MIDKKKVTVTTQGSIQLGRQGENGVLEVHFPQSAAMIGETWEGNHQRSTDTAAYPVALEKQGNDLVWLVTSGDTAIPGTGRFELTCYGEDGQVLKSKTYSTQVTQSLVTGGNAPVTGYSKPTGTVYINSNGTHDVTKYASAQVDVPTSEGGITPSGTLDIEENGTFNVTYYENARVNVPVPAGYLKPAGTKTVTTNGTHDVGEYKSVNVNVPAESGASGTVEIDSNGLHDIASYAKANVNVPVPDGYIQPTGTKNITSNGTHNVKEYENVNVDVASTGIDTSDATLTEALCPSGYTFYADGEEKTGTMPRMDSWAYADSNVISVSVVGDALRTIWNAPKNGYTVGGMAFETQFNAARLGDATAADVVAGKTFTSANGVKLTGTYEASSGGGSSNIYRASATLDSTYSTASWQKLCNIPFLGENISNSGLFVILNRVSTSAVNGAVSICAASNGAYFNGKYFVSVIHGTYSASVDTLSSSSYTLSSSSDSSYTRIYADSSGNLYIRPDGSGTKFASGEYMILYGIF